VTYRVSAIWRFGIVRRAIPIGMVGIHLVCAVVGSLACPTREPKIT
jgi:hypothetical protein